MESDRLLSVSSQRPQTQEEVSTTQNAGFCPLLKKMRSMTLRLKQSAVTLCYAFDDPRTGLGLKFVLLSGILLAINPLDFLPLESPIVVFLDLVLTPLLIWLSLKLVPAEVLEEARHAAQGTNYRLTPLKRHWQWAFMMYIFWTSQLVIIAFKELPQLLLFLHCDNASAWTAQHRALLALILLGVFNLKCVIVVIWCMVKAAQDSQEGRQSLEAGIIYNRDQDGEAVEGRCTVGEC